MHPTSISKISNGCILFRPLERADIKRCADRAPEWTLVAARSAATDQPLRADPRMSRALSTLSASLSW
jgi:hypothetical protein